MCRLRAQTLGSKTHGICDVDCLLPGTEGSKTLVLNTLKKQILSLITLGHQRESTRSCSAVFLLGESMQP